MTTTTTEMQAVEMLNGFFNEYESKSGVAHVDKGFTALVGMHYGNGYKVVAIKRCYNTVDEAIEAVRYFADKADNEFKHNNYGRVGSGVGRNRKEYFKLGYKGYQLLTAEYFNAIIDEYAVSEAAMEVAVEAEVELANEQREAETVPAKKVVSTSYKNGRLTVKYDGKKSSLQAAVEDVICDYRREPITVINHYGEEFTYTRHIDDMRIGRVWDNFKAYLRDVAKCKPITDEMVNGFKQAVKANFFIHKIYSDAQPYDDNDNVFNLLPTLDELNDVDNEPEPPTDYVGRKLVQDNSCSKFAQFYIGDAENYKEELITFDAGRWMSIKSNYYGVEIYNGTDNKIHFRVGKFFDDASGEWIPGPGKIITNADEFFRIMSERGACTIDEAEPPTVEEIFAELPDDPNADNYRMARYITYAYSDGTNYAIRSTDFLRAEKALALLKAALTKQIGEYKFGIDFYPIEFDAKKIVTIYHAEELDGSEEDEETFTPDVMPVEDGDDDELIDPPEKDLSTLKYFDNVRLIRSKWGEVWEVYELRDVRKYRSRGSKRVELCQRGRNERWWTISPKELTLRLDEYGLTIADLKPYVESRGRVIA